MKSEVYCIDCIKFMRELPDNRFDLAIVDPPYGINATEMQMGSHPNRSRNDGYGSGPAISTAVKAKKNRLQRLNGGGGKLKNRILNKSVIDWDYEVPSDEYFQELFRISKNQVIWGGNYFKLPPTRGIIAWDKLQPWENFSQFELAWTSFDKPAKMFRYSNTGGGNHEKKIHPTQKPVDLYKYVLHHFAKEGDQIYDSHLGSGSNRIACHEYGFDFVANEIDRTMYESQEVRFKNHIAQTKLFV